MAAIPGLSIYRSIMRSDLPWLRCHCPCSGLIHAHGRRPVIVHATEISISVSELQHLAAHHLDPQGPSTSVPTRRLAYHASMIGLARTGVGISRAQSTVVVVVVLTGRSHRRHRPSWPNDWNRIFAGRARTGVCASTSIDLTSRPCLALLRIHALAVAVDLRPPPQGRRIDPCSVVGYS